MIETVRGSGFVLRPGRAGARARLNRLRKTRSGSFCPISKKSGRRRPAQAYRSPILASIAGLVVSPRALPPRIRTAPDLHGRAGRPMET